MNFISLSYMASYSLFLGRVDFVVFFDLSERSLLADLMLLFLVLDSGRLLEHTDFGLESIRWFLDYGLGDTEFSLD